MFINHLLNLQRGKTLRTIIETKDDRARDADSEKYIYFAKSRNKFQVTVHKAGKTYSGGYYNDIQEAKEARDSLLFRIALKNPEQD